MRLVTPDADSAHVQFPPPILYLLALTAGVSLDEWAGLLPLELRAHLRLVASAPLALVGVALMIAGAGLFRQLGINVKPWQTSARLVTTGVFRWTRNPMYLGMSLLYAGLAILADSGTALILLPPVLVVIVTQVIAREERYLEQKFGDDYRAYKARVRRWL